MFELRKLAVVAAAILLCVGSYSQVRGEVASPDTAVSQLDTIRVQTAYGLPGDSVNIRMYIANHSIALGGLNFILKFDSTYAYPAYRWDEIINYGDTSAPLYYQFIERGWNTAQNTNYLSFINSVNAVDTNTSGQYIVTGVFVADFSKSWDYIAIGSGVFLQFWVHIKPQTPIGTVIHFDIFDEQQVVGEEGFRENEFYDTTGTVGKWPTQVDGVLIVGEEGPGEANRPPFFTSPGSGQVFNVEQGQTVQFNVSASDLDVGQPLTLRMLSGPSGSTFTQTSGTGNVSNTFSWTTNFTNSGSYNATFQVVDDSAASATVTAIISVGGGVVEPPDKDLLYTSSKSPGGFIEGGIPGAVDVSVPVNLIELNTLYGIEFNMAYSYAAMSMDSVVPTNRLEGFEVYSQSIGAGKTKVVAFGLDNETVQPATTTIAIFDCWFSIKQAAMPGWYKFTLSDGRVSFQPGQPSTDMDVDSLGAVAVDRMGDVNLDTLVDVGDLVTVVGHIIGNYELELRQFRTGNINGDAEVNVVDLVAIINIIFTGAPSPPMPKFASFGKDAEVDISFDLGQLALEADLPTEVAGLQFDLRYDPNDVELGRPELTELSDGLELLYKDLGQGRMRVLMYLPVIDLNEVIDAGIGRLVTVPVYAYDGSRPEDGTVMLENVVLSDPYGQEIPVARKQGQLPSAFTLEQNYPNPFNPETNIRFSVNGDAVQNVRLVVYNILGQNIATLLEKDLAPGSYEASWDGTNSSGEKQASGVYFYSLIAGNSRETKKMVLAK
jgi:hypothetical protein